MTEPIEKLKLKLQQFSKKELIELLLSNDDSTINENSSNHIEYKLKTFYNALHTAKIGVWEWKIAERKLTMVTDTFDFLGHDVGTWNLDFESLLDVIHPDDRRTVNSGFERYSLIYPESHTYEFRMINDDGGYQWVVSTGRVSKFDQNGVPVLVAGIYRDVTKWRLAQRNLKKSEDRFKMLSNMAKEGVLFHRHGTIVDINHAVVDILGYERSDLIGHNFNDFLDEGSIDVDSNPDDGTTFSVTVPNLNIVSSI